MHELSQQDFNEVKPLLTGAPIHSEILSIIEEIIRAGFL